MKAKYRKIAVGGTFDKLHKGHEALLDAAFTMADEVLIGITSDDFASMKNHVIEPCEVRITKLKSIIKPYNKKYIIKKIMDSNGTADIIIEWILADDGVPISSTRIRKGEIDQKGTLL